MLCCLREYQKRTAQVYANNLVKGCGIAFSNRRWRHDASVLNDDVCAAELVQGLGQKLFDLSSITDIGFDCDCFATLGSDLRNDLLGFRCAARIINDYGEAILGEPLGYRLPNSSVLQCGNVLCRRTEAG